MQHLGHYVKTKILAGFHICINVPLSEAFFVHSQNIYFLKATSWKYFSGFYYWRKMHVGHQRRWGDSCFWMQLHEWYCMLLYHLSENEVVAAVNKNVLILMIHVYSKYMVKRRWAFRYKNDKCADIETISSFLGKWYALILSIFSFHYDIRRGLPLKHFLKSGLFRTNCLCAWQFLNWDLKSVVIWCRSALSKKTMVRIKVVCSLTLFYVWFFQKWN